MNIKIKVPKSKTKKGAEKPQSAISNLLNPKSKNQSSKEELDDYKYIVGYTGQIPINIIECDPNQPRKNFQEDKLQELAQSIKEQGMIQIPAVRKNGNKIILVAGERRYRAHKLLERKTMKCTIIKTEKPEELAIVENIQRENLNPIEEAEGLLVLKDKYNYKQKELAMRIGKSRQTVQEILSLNNLPDEIKIQCHQKDIPKRALYKIVRKTNVNEMIETFNLLLTGKVKSDDLGNKKKDRKANTPFLITTLHKTESLKKSLNKINDKCVDLNSENGEKLLKSLCELMSIMETLNRDKNSNFNLKVVNN